MNSKLGNIVLNVATVAITALAMITGGLRLREWLAQPQSQGAGPSVRRIARWKQFDTGDLRLGPASARVTIVEFSDFQCPYCRMAAGDLRNVREWYPKDVAVLYRHFPLHHWAHAAAAAADCAGKLGHFEALHDLFFAMPDSIGVKPWSSFAREVGIADTARFETCMSSQAVANVITRDSIAATSLNALGTPTLLINDLAVYGSPGFEQLVGYVRAALSKSSH